MPSYSAEHEVAFGSVLIEHHTADRGLIPLFMAFTSDRPVNPWTLQYEATIFVLGGELRLVVMEDGHARTGTAAVGELAVLPTGSTACFARTESWLLLLTPDRSAASSRNSTRHAGARLAVKLLISPVSN